MPDQVGLVIGPTGATGGPIAAAVWERIVARHGLEKRSLESLASWEYADFVFAREWDLLTDTGKLRRAGSNACVDTIAMLRDQLDRYREAGLLPR